MDAIAAFHVGTVSRVATGYDAGRELHCPGNILLHFIEAAILIDDRGIGRDVFRLLAGQVAAGVEGVNTHIEERPTAGEFLAEPPFARGNVKAEGALNGLHLAQCALADEPDRFQVGRLRVAAISDHQLYAGPPCRPRSSPRPPPRWWTSASRKARVCRLWPRGSCTRHASNWAAPHRPHRWPGCARFHRSFRSCR